MIRLLLALIVTPLLLGAAPAPQRDWTRVVNRSVDGAYVIGNPAAKVKLVEYLSYTCPHCAHYAAEAKPVLHGRYVRSGSTSVELRHATRDSVDFAATIVARCGGAATFPRLSEALFATQRDWYPRGVAFEQANAARLSALTPEVQLREIAYASGFDAIAKSAGINDVRLRACFANRPALLQISAMSDKSWAAINAAAAPMPGGTPSFVVNGKPQGTLAWPALDPVLRAAGAK